MLFAHLGHRDVERSADGVEKDVGTQCPPGLLFGPRKIERRIQILHLDLELVELLIPEEGLGVPTLKLLHIDLRALHIGDASLMRDLLLRLASAVFPTTEHLVYGEVGIGLEVSSTMTQLCEHSFHFVMADQAVMIPVNRIKDLVHHHLQARRAAQVPPAKALEGDLPIAFLADTSGSCLDDLGGCLNPHLLQKDPQLIRIDEAAAVPVDGFEGLLDAALHPGNGYDASRVHYVLISGEQGDDAGAEGGGPDEVVIYVLHT
mmetsp:Transcript_24335/g.54191  ORF Transcript_24335/g.54191 Transcript_24335/m.54191 type:complete len:261 (+) Transcript_24335:619-1401(+)